MVVLAVDVGLQVCGVIICEVHGNSVTTLHESEIKPPKKQLIPQRLEYIYTELTRIIQKYKPEYCVVENLYSHHRHPTTLGKLAQVKGVISLLACQVGLKFFEFSPTRARKSFIGRGNVTSEQVKKMAESITGTKFKSVHTADAYSLIIAFSHAYRVKDINLAVTITGAGKSNDW